MNLTRRHALGSLAAASLIGRWGPARAATAFKPSPDLVADANKDG